MHNHHHSINLGTVWEPPAAAESDGRLVWRRRFGRPGGLAAGERVLLVFGQPMVGADVSLNAVRLPPLSAGMRRWAQDVTPLLRDRNELLLAVATAAGDAKVHGQQGRGSLPSIIGPVALQIVSADDALDRFDDA